MAGDSTNSGGGIDIGGVQVDRTALASLIADPDRFERFLPDALAVDAAMRDNDGQVPGYVSDWPRERIAAVVATLKDVGNLRERANREINKNEGSSPESVPVREVFRRSSD